MFHGFKGACSVFGEENFESLSTKSPSKTLPDELIVINDQDDWCEWGLHRLRHQNSELGRCCQVLDALKRGGGRPDPASLIPGIIAFDSGEATCVF